VDLCGLLNLMVGCYVDLLFVGICTSGFDVDLYGVGNDG
jgi:hypothetical protein